MSLTCPVNISNSSLIEIARDVISDLEIKWIRILRTGEYNGIPGYGKELILTNLQVIMLNSIEEHKFAFLHLREDFQVCCLYYLTDK